VFYEWLRRSVARVLRSARFERVLDGSAHFVLPAWCAGCDDRLSWRPAPLGLCERCRSRLPGPPSRERCRLCGATTMSRGASDWLCVACARRPPGFDGLIAAWSYRPPIDEVVRRLKYGRLEFLAEDLALGIAVALAEDRPGYDYVSPVPLHWRRRLERGYDQAALVAAGVARRSGLPYRETLVRVRATPPQAARSARERRANVTGAFRCRARVASRVRGASILLVDDVVTTGATLDAASRALKAAGAARVTGLVAALVPPTDKR
jgi:ComF family protein